MHIRNTKAIKGYLNGSNNRHGITTILIDKSSGKRLYEVIGPATKSQLYAQWFPMTDKQKQEFSDSLN